MPGRAIWPMKILSFLKFSNRKLSLDARKGHVALVIDIIYARFREHSMEYLPLATRV